MADNSIGNGYCRYFCFKTSKFLPIANFLRRSNQNALTVSLIQGYLFRVKRENSPLLSTKNTASQIKDGYISIPLSRQIYINSAPASWHLHTRP